jgi:adenosylcobyric acid synthase
LGKAKQLRVEHAVLAHTSMSLKGYHMHMGVTSGPDCDHPFSLIDGASDGATSSDRRVEGTYLHGIFASDAFRHAFLHIASGIRFEQGVEDVLNELAAHLDRHLDLDALLALAGEVR